jgi:hypothetical protein
MTLGHQHGPSPILPPSLRMQFRNRQAEQSDRSIHCRKIERE